MTYDYELTRRAAALGDGWNLKLLQDGEHVGGGVFPLAWPETPEQSMTWWNAMSEAERAHWLAVARSARPVDARYACLLEEAHLDAIEEAETWLASRTVEP